MREGRNIPVVGTEAAGGEGLIDRNGFDRIGFVLIGWIRSDRIGSGQRHV